jgi:hypothetical protein
MDRLSQQAVVSGARAGARRGFALAALLLAMASGCVSSGQLVPNLGDKPPVAQMTAVWSNQLMAGVDPTHNGAPMVGLAGRVFLYGPELKDSVLADGKVVVELYAPPPEQPQAPPVRMEVWEITKDKLNGVCLRKDFFGQGYTLNLPWPSYRPDITQVQLRMRYEPEKGMPVYTQEVLTFNGSAAAPQYSKRVETGDRQVIATQSPPTAPPGGAVQPTGFVQPAGASQAPVTKSFEMQLPGTFRR